ncbi:FAD-dependent monooxygenase [soil metagenome]
MSGEQLDVPVLIVGAGPAGLASSLALTRYGVEHLLIERHAGTAHTPRAHIINQRTVEILRHLGIEDRLHAVAAPWEMMRNNLWVTSLAGQEILRSEGWGTSDRVFGEYRSSSPCSMANCPQIVFEPMLVDAIVDAGGAVHFRHELQTLVQDADGVTSTVLNRDTGEVFTVRSQFVIGADGARGRVLDLAGLAVEGPAGLVDVASVWFEADLTRYLAHRPGVLTWNMMPGQPAPMRLGILVCHKPFTEFLLAFAYDRALGGLEQFSTEDLVARIRAAVGDEDIEVAIKDVSGWQINAQVAPTYSANRVFCMGDAVHRHPPYNGLGLNMSVADAYNLAWKLALVLDGRAGPALLDTYTAERQPVGAAGVQRAITSVGDMAGIDEAMGLKPGQAAEDDWAALAALDEPGPQGVERRRALHEAAKIIDYQQNAHGLELGYVYSSAAIVGDGTPAPEPAQDDILHYKFTSRPGARVPHARLELDGAAISSLDLVDGLGFALLTGKAGQHWQQAAADIVNDTGVPITVHLIGRGTGGPADPYGEWAERSEIHSDGCVLVRPDRHVAWRYESFDDGAATALRHAVDRVLGLEDSTELHIGDAAAGVTDRSTDARTTV